MPKKLSQEEFIERCKKKHNSYYSYDKTVYTGMSNDDYIIVTCPIHGDFKQLAAGHIRGKGCKDCAGTITKTTEQFIIDARKVHGDEYDYSKSKYINAMTYIEIICRKHGSFWQKPNTHLIGKGCFECYGSKMLTQEEFINRCILYHERVINGVWTKASIILACQFDFTWHNDASILVKTPTKAEQAANKNYVDTQISTISQFDSSSDQTISGTWKFSKPLKITEAQLTDEAVSKGYVDETIQQNLNTTLEGVIKFVSMTEAEYKALETKSPSTIYHLTDVSMWAIGDQEIVTSNMPA